MSPNERISSNLSVVEKMRVPSADSHGIICMDETRESPSTVWRQRTENDPGSGIVSLKGGDEENRSLMELVSKNSLDEDEPENDERGSKRLSREDRFK